MTVCSMTNESYASLSGARVVVTLNPFESTNQITVCRQCAKPSCAEACSEGAISRDDAGVMVVDYARCTSCWLCIDACPFHAMLFNPISKKVIKCELCHGDPQCVQACPTGALSLRVVPSAKAAEND
jgi:Fe-S-cluster-containing hydrogenase component 2